MVYAEGLRLGLRGYLILLTRFTRTESGHAFTFTSRHTRVGYGPGESKFSEPEESCTV